MSEALDAIEDTIKYVLDDDPNLDAESFVERVRAEVEHENLSVEDGDVEAVLEQMESDGYIYFDDSTDRWYLV